MTCARLARGNTQAQPGSSCIATIDVGVKEPLDNERSWKPLALICP
jgi:hypothetical protein